MLSHLRFHRRGPSNPSSPGPDQPPASPLSAQSPYPLDGLSPHDGRPPSSSSSALPPTLPPITRVTTDETDLRLSPPREADNKITAPPQQETRPAPQMARSPYNADSGFIGGVALRKYQRDMQAQTSGRPEPADKPAQPTGQDTRQQTFAPPQRPAPVDMDVPTRPLPQVMSQPRPASSFSTPTDLQNTTTATGRRPAGTRLPTEPPAMAASTESLEPQRGKRSLPFLKNPMSTLLARRKNNQNVPDLSPLQTEEPFNDPRIRGTRVHDFSAPRRRNNAPSNDPKLSQSASHSTLASARDRRPSDALDLRDNAQQGGSLPRGMSSASDSAQSGSISAVSQTIPESQSFSPESANDLVKQMPPEQPDRSAPPVPPKDDVAPSLRSIPSKASRISTQGIPAQTMASASTRTARSRNISLSEMSHRDTISSIPKHMKSTSSRFSFDMIGAAKQEKLLEERHRQREIERQTTDDDGTRDSRFDDFEDDGFDYDAMMDDDGLEERIPGVNADYEEDDYIIEEEMDPSNDEELDPDNGQESDPDNDQENFSGFVFQRSDPTSLVTSPHSAGIMATPRDDEGNVIGFAMSRDTPNLLKSPLVPDTQALASQQGLGAPATGLGIQGTTISEQPEEDDEGTVRLDFPVPPSAAPQTIQDELYFDGGAMGFGDEFADELAFGPNGDDEPFDESIFDNNDTDRFGRPVPGAFAQAQSSRREVQQVSVKRESDMTSRFSAQSGLSRSTAHTSLSYDARPPRNSNEEKTTSPPAVASDEASAPAAESISVAAYQAALAAAAHKAAASGKFQRTSSPPSINGRKLANEPAGVPNRSPTAEVGDEFDEGYEDNFDDYGQSYEDMDDFELDDDAIIAEANASALANDSDGWYGQEFGFYSANGHGNSGPADYDYVNGGVFGPKGMNGVDRSTSGRNISREPNLTPITERSEYSNRNSVMSLGMAPFASGTPVQSPGLAQLAMMADRGDDQMTLSSLLRLRSRAWGGSQASLVSSKDGSPKSERGDAPSSPWGPHSGSFPVGGGGHMRKNSIVSMMSRESDAGSPPGSPTLTGGIPDLLNYDAPPPVPGSEEQSVDQHGDDQTSRPPPPKPKPHPLYTNNLTNAEAKDRPLSAISQASSTEWNRGGGDSARTSMSSRRPGMGHRHKGSADSISYMMEEESGETRWVMERRRTGESGQVEILEREVVEGGRI